MKKLIAISLLIAVGACSGTDQDSSRENFKAVENNTGKVLGNAGEIVGAGVNVLDKSWETPEEQRRKQEEAEQLSDPAGGQ